MLPSNSLLIALVDLKVSPFSSYILIFRLSVRSPLSYLPSPYPTSPSFISHSPSAFSHTLPPFSHVRAPFLPHPTLFSTVSPLPSFSLVYTNTVKENPPKKSSWHTKKMAAIVIFQLYKITMPHKCIISSASNEPLVSKWKSWMFIFLLN
ncbi:hypothetical protein FKM82_003135 [Ascaphus truei]